MSNIFSILSSNTILIQANTQEEAIQKAQEAIDRALKAAYSHPQCRNAISIIQSVRFEEKGLEVRTRVLEPGWYICKENGTRAQIFMVPVSKDKHSNTTHADKMVRLFPTTGEHFEITPEQCDEYNLTLAPH